VSRYGPRAPDGPRIYKVEVTLSEGEMTLVRALGVRLGWCDAATLREAAKLTYEMLLRDAENDNLPGDWTRRIA